MPPQENDEVGDIESEAETFLSPVRPPTLGEIDQALRPPSGSPNTIRRPQNLTESQDHASQVRGVTDLNSQHSFTSEGPPTPSNLSTANPNYQVSYNLSRSTEQEEKEEEIADLSNTPLYAVASLQQTTEATVLEESRNDPWTQAFEEDQELVAMKQAACAGYDYRNLRQDEEDQEATVVAITDGAIHPSDISTNAVHAELIGEDYRSGADNEVAFHTVDEEANQSSTPLNVNSVEAVDQDHTAEATVIDSAPITDNDEHCPHWKYTEIVQVMLTEEDESRATPLNERKPAAVDDGNENFEDSIRDEIGGHVLGQQAEVVGIQEFFHPSEVSNNESQAELIGTDETYNIAIATSITVGEPRVEEGHQEHSSGAFREAAVIGSGIRSTSPEAMVNRDYLPYSRNEEIYSPPGCTTPAISNAFYPDFSPTFDSQSDDFVFDTSLIHANNSDHIDLPPPLAPPPTSRGNNIPRDESTDDIPAWLDDSTSPAQQTFSSTGRREVSGNSASATSTNTASSQRSGINVISSNIARSTNNVMEALFGDTKFNRRSTSHETEVSSIMPRTLLPWSVIFSPAINMWVATLQTNQKALDSNDLAEANKSLRAFSLATEQQAISLARAWTPPRMLPFRDNPVCHICRAKFAVFRRACHCRNCGVVVCKDCSTQWPAKMIPDTYNIKRENTVNVCNSCDWLSHSFRLALLEGNCDKAVALHATGNVNLTSPFSNVKGEVFYPVHTAVIGGNLAILEWLVDDQCCPIKSIRVSGGSRNRDSAGKYIPVVTSKGRSLLGMALEQRNISILRYLVVEKTMSVAGEKDITTDMLVANLESVLHFLPPSSNFDSPPEWHASKREEFAFPFSTSSESNDERTLSDGAQEFGAFKRQEDFVESRQGDECIICCDMKIDCVAVKCGHQICCLECSKNFRRCPVCAAECTFMRVFKP